MQPFDLEAAKRGEPIQTRDGRPVEFIAHAPDSSFPNRRVACLIGGNFHLYRENGAWLSTAGPHVHDLFMAPKKRTVWVNLYEYPITSDRFDSYAYATEAAADAACVTPRMGNRAWPLEIEG